MTGILLALARISGETAPLLFTAFEQPVLEHRSDSADRKRAGGHLPVRDESVRRLALPGLGRRLHLTMFVLLLSASLPARSSRATRSPMTNMHDSRLAGLAAHACVRRRPRRAAEADRARPRLLLRRLPRAEEHRHGHGREERHRHHRPVRLRQVHPAAHLQPHLLDLPEAERQRRSHARRREHPRPALPAQPPAQQGRHGVPEAGAVPDVDLRQHRLRHPPPREARRAPTWTSASSRRCARPRCGTK